MHDNEITFLTVRKKYCTSTTSYCLVFEIVIFVSKCDYNAALTHHPNANHNLDKKIKCTIIIITTLEL